MHIRLRPHTEVAKGFYTDHGHYHAGDAGLDLFVIEALTIHPGETAAIKFQISCETDSGQPYYLMPRSSISKTPLRMATQLV